MRHLDSFVARMARAERMKFDSGMVALVPDERSALKLAHHSPEAEPVDQLHVTIRYLGPSDMWSVPDQAKLIEAVADLGSMGAVPGTPWAIASLNPTTENACVAYIVGGLELTLAHDQINDKINSLDLTAEIPVPHSPWVPHITLGYGIKAESVSTAPTGVTISFDRIRIGFSETYRDILL